VGASPAGDGGLTANHSLTEILLTQACETLASANVMATELAFTLNGLTCSALLGIQQMIFLAESSVNRVLDQVDPQT
jgi:hypothetical protein